MKHILPVCCCLNINRAIAIKWYVEVHRTNHSSPLLRFILSHHSCFLLIGSSRWCLFFFEIFTIGFWCLCIWWGWGWWWQEVNVELRGQHGKICSLFLPLHVFSESSSGHQVCSVSTFTTEPAPCHPPSHPLGSLQSTSNYKLVYRPDKKASRRH